MPSTKEHAGTIVELDDEGYFKDPRQWTETMVDEIAADNGIELLTDRHWQAIRYVRRTYEETGSAPALRAVGKGSGVPIRELYALFPHGPALRQVAKIAGVPKPISCVQMTEVDAMTDAAIRAAFEDGPLGILVTRAEARSLVADLLAEANALGIEAKVFFMDEGVWLLADHAWVEGLPAATYSACDLSVRQREIDPADRVNVAGQFHNAMMVSDAARVVTL